YRYVTHDRQTTNRGSVEPAAKDRISNTEATAGGTRIEQIRIDAWKDDIRAQPENNQVAECIQDPYPKVFDRENILYGGKEPLHYFNVVAVPPAASIAFTAVAENACASTLSFFFNSPLPRIFTRSFLPTIPLSTSVWTFTLSALIFSARPSSTSRFTALKYSLLGFLNPNFGTRRCRGI